MDDSQDKIRTFLRQHIPKPNLALAVSTRLEPFFRVAESGRYPLPPDQALTDGALHRAINGTFDLPAVRFERVSRVQVAFVEPRKEVLGQPQSWQLGRTFAEAMPPKLRLTLPTEVGSYLWTEMVMAFSPWISRRLRPAVGNDLLETVAEFIHFFVAAALADNEDALERYEPMSRLLPYAFPAGSLVRDPSAWVVLAT